eukprot:693601-Rhodomonas_salina.1
MVYDRNSTVVQQHKAIQQHRHATALQTRTHDNDRHDISYDRATIAAQLHHQGIVLPSQYHRAAAPQQPYNCLMLGTTAPQTCAPAPSHTLSLSHT